MLGDIFACETGEGELGDLDPDPALAAVQDLDWLDFVADDDVCGRGDEVESERFGHEGEGARHAEVALDHLQVVVLGDQLHVEGACDVERVGDVSCDVADLGIKSVGSRDFTAAATLKSLQPHAIM